MEVKALLVHSSHQGVCGRHGMEDRYVTCGGLVMSGGYTLKDGWVNIIGMIVLWESFW